jgi:hypothetical protein
MVVVLGAGEDGVEVGERAALRGFGHEISTIGYTVRKLPTPRQEGL